MRTFFFKSTLYKFGSGSKYMLNTIKVGKKLLQIMLNNLYPFVCINIIIKQIKLIKQYLVILSVIRALSC